MIAEIFEKQGFLVELTSKTRDGGCDIIALYNKLDTLLKIIIECKRFGKKNKVGIEYVQRIFGVKIAENANKALLVTTSTFTDPARQFEKEHYWDLELKDYLTVTKWIKEYNEMLRGIS
ncbi:MAG: restriction endonuclease [Candidatus Aminicenantales bacterium]